MWLSCVDDHRSTHARHVFGVDFFEIPSQHVGCWLIEEQFTHTMAMKQKSQRSEIKEWRCFFDVFTAIRARYRPAVSRSAGAMAVFELERTTNNGQARTMRRYSQM
jgi:hypothetical protein